MKVLLYSALPKKMQGGIATWTKVYLDNCKKQDITTILVNCEAEGARAENPEAKMSFKDEIIRTLRIYKDLRKRLKERPDIAHVNTSCGPFGIIRDCIAVRILKRRKIHTVVHFHCDIPFWVKSVTSVFFLKSICKNADELFVLCWNSKAYLKHNFNVNATIVPNFVPKENITKDHVIRKKCKNVIYVGGIQPDKGCYDIFKIAKALPNHVFNLIGQLDDRVESVNIPPNIVLHGSMPHNKVLDFLDDSDVFLFPSHSEGFSLALAEAMSRGLPIIATDVGANADMIESSGGYICQVGNVSDMVSCFEKIDSDEIRKNMSVWNINKVKVCYNADKVLALIKERYQDVSVR